MEMVHVGFDQMVEMQLALNIAVYTNWIVPKKIQFFVK